MRPIKLIIQAFGPYITPQTLDFDKHLRGEKIFLIHGKTGAGKTTILDAICFALYGSASGDERNGAMMRSKGISEKILTEVEFTFALGEKIYSARRTLSRHSNRKTNQNQITAELKCGKEVVETQATRVTNAVTDLLGFNAEQFRQVVLLPQGEFKNFLAADSKERQPVLDALFNAEFYSRIEAGLKTKADAAQRIFDDLNRDKNTLTAKLQGAKLDDAALEKIRADLDAAQKKSAELKTLLDKAQGEFTAGKILAGDFAELGRRTKALGKAQENLQDAEKFFVAAKIEFDRRDAERPQRDKLKSDIDKLIEIKKSLDDLEGKKKIRDDAEKKLQDATAALQKCETNAKNFDARLAQLKKRRSELIDAQKILAEAKNISGKVGDREELLRTIARLETDLAIRRKKIVDAEKIFRDAQIDLERLQKLQRDGSAALLAKNLRDGEPCPVCGSRVHEHVDFGDALIPSDNEIAAAQKNADRCKKNLDEANIDAAQIDTTVANKRDELKKFADLPAVALAKKNLDAALKDAAEFDDCEKRIATGEEYIAKNAVALDSARKNHVDASSERAQRRGEVQTLEAQIPEKYSTDSRQLDTDLDALKKTSRELENAWQDAQNNFRNAGNKKSVCEGALNAAQISQREFADKLKNSAPPDLDALKTRADAAQKNHEAAIRGETSLKNSLDDLTNTHAQLVALDEKIFAAEKNLRVWKKLSDAANGKISGNKLSFARYYLGAMFQQVLTEANYRLAKMSDRRYSLKIKRDGARADSALGLNLEILDDFTGETRPVATLSGGESFLASLSLALGLAAVVRNNLGGIKLDTIFIDEGFGSLDSEALDGAISTIVDQSGGRLVGIISHVEELKNQMPVRLEVTSGKTGSTAEFKHGSARD